jgi:hypothetical protein
MGCRERDHTWLGRHLEPVIVFRVREGKPDERGVGAPGSSAARLPGSVNGT